MSSIKTLNQPASMWDFIASLEEQGMDHLLFAAFASLQGMQHPPEPPRGREFRGGAHGHGGLGGRGDRGRGSGLHRHGERGHHDHEKHHQDFGRHDFHGHDPRPKESHERGPPHHGSGPTDHGGPSHPPHPGPPPHGPPHERPSCPSPPPAPPGGEKERHRSGAHRGGHHGVPAGFGRCGPERGFPLSHSFDLNDVADFFQSQLSGSNQGAYSKQNNQADNGSNDFSPLVDVFDGESAFVVHVSLAGANKDRDDIAVNWDHERSELNISGVIYRPGNEDFLKTLAMDEREVGAFSRKIKLGSRARPALVDANGISAKLEDGLLRITVPKEDKDFVEVRMVDIE